ncbi:SPOR domain-containing protein [Candidatus Propionivibrio aalborgensis]|nr:SPOR domain-containing protein [Candidatus Propionivibrio aalborgensis]
MKPRKHSKATARRRSGGGMLVGIFVGLVLGVLCAAGVVWYIFKTPPPFSNKGQPSPSTAQQAGTTVAPLALPGKPGDPVPQNGDKPRFDFYKILPGNAEAIPDPKPTEVVKDKGEKENMLKESVYLQTGSFQNVDDADNQKTKLALMGVEASVQQVMLQDRVWYRVRLGPFRKMDEVNNMRSDLAKQGIEASLVRKD